MDNVVMHKKSTVSLLLFCCISSLIFSSCSFVFNNLNQPTDDDAKTLALKVLMLLDNKDAEKLESLFSEEARNSVDLDKQIQEAFEFYGGKSISYDKKRSCYINYLIREVLLTSFFAK